MDDRIADGPGNCGVLIRMNPASFYRRLTRTLLAGVLAAAVGCGDGVSHPRQIRQIEPSMLAATWPEPAGNAYSIVQKEKTVGRFPCSLTVVRVTSPVLDDPDSTAGSVMKLDLLTDIEGVPWIELFDNFPLVSSVRLLGRPAVIYEKVTLTELIEAARRQDASLCLIYGERDLSGTQVRLIGALYDCATGALVATIDASVEPDAGMPPPPGRVRTDHRHKDPGCLTTSRFQDLVLRCIDELHRNDAPAPTTQPNPWERPGVNPMMSPWSTQGPGW
jgi:hypothetical protein